MFKKTAFLIISLCISMATFAQSTLYSYTFDSDAEGWETISLSNSGFWEWTDNGTADQGTYWNDRLPIDETENGAIVYDGDFMISSNQGDSTINYLTAMQSPILDFSANTSVYLKFNQYYRNFKSNTSIEISSDLGTTWNIVNLNENVKRNVETSPRDIEIIDISQFAAGHSRVLVRFVFDGEYYFWILDDIYFYDDYPVMETKPTNIGEYLTLHGYPYEVDDKGWPYIPNEVIINFAPGVTELEKQLYRKEAGAILKETCVCNTLETWTLVDSLLEGGIGLSSTGPTTGADAQVQTSTSSSEIDEADHNKYVKSELLEGNYVQPSINQILAVIKPPKNKKLLKVAIIDTGVDILHDGLANTMHLSNDIPFNGYDDDENCYVDNVVGWNFVEDNNNASDDHGHGTHVAGIISNYSLQYNTKNKIDIIPYKTHDFRGLANLFDVTCAMYQSIEDNAAVVNCSWGFYGNESDVLRNAIKKAWGKKMTVVAASGNDSFDLGDLQQYPACYQLPNVITVGSYNYEKEEGMVINSPFSNYNSEFVDVLAPGVSIFSTIPDNSYDYKTGTSMAAPAVAGLAAKKYMMGYSDPELVKESILIDAQDHDHLLYEVWDGNVLIQNSSETEMNSSVGQAGENTYSQRQSNLLDQPEINQMNVSFLISRNQINLEFKDDYQDVRIFIVNSQGQHFINKELENIKSGSVEIIDLVSLPAGFYYMKINERVHEFIVY